MSSRNTNTSDNVRRSSRIRGKVSYFPPENEEKRPIRRCRGGMRKKESEEVQEEQQHTPSTYHEMPHGGTEEAVIDVSSPEETKPNIDILFMLEHEMKPNPRERVLPEDCQHLINAATVLKSQLVARLTSSSDVLTINDMVVLANRCYCALRELGDDYKSFSTEVYQMIAQHQELAFAAKEMDNWNDWDLKTRYVQQVELLSDVHKNLYTTQEYLDRAMAKVDTLKFKKEKLKAAFRVLEEALSEEEERIKTLTTERDGYKNTYDNIEVELKNLDAEKGEALRKFEAINGRYKNAKEEVKRMNNHLQQFVRKSPIQDSVNFSTSNEAVVPRSSSAELTPSPSTASP